MGVGDPKWSKFFSKKNYSFMTKTKKALDEVIELDELNELNELERNR